MSLWGKMLSEKFGIFKPTEVFERDPRNLGSQRRKRKKGLGGFEPGGGGVGLTQGGVLNSKVLG